MTTSKRLISEDEVHHLHCIKDSLIIFGQLLESAGTGNVTLTAENLHSISNNMVITLEKVIKGINKRKINND